MHDDGRVISDEEGLELPTLEAVQDEAAHALTDLARDKVRKDGDGPRKLSIWVRDANGPVMVASLSFEVKRLR